MLVSDGYYPTRLIGQPACAESDAPIYSKARTSSSEMASQFLRSAISGNSGQDAGRMVVWREGVFDGQ